ncbi:uncharacterized protein LOC142588579 [Dermacentor variabilis]|uniref:uncharacterized protein LOC142588579 n=1 Tax=Dermacentor variabilis TaxID=34621 RepID=UPI003F5C83FF
MALNRLDWIASALDALAPEQSGFRRLRSTADSIADVVATLEHAASRHEAAYLVLLDVERAFDGLPHGTIIQALHELRVTGRLLDYVSAFLSDRTLRVRVGDELSTPRSVTAGVPQGSVLSPFLFNLALARLPDFIPKLTAFEVRVAIYADDIALFASGPTDYGCQVRQSLQSAINAVDEYLTSVGLQLSASKTEALMIHPRASRARSEVPTLSLRGSPLPWRKKVRYLGLHIDCRLNFNAATSQLCKDARKVAGAARSLLARGRGCTPHLALRVYNSIATARALYALPLTNASAANWRAVDVEHRTAIRQMYALPRFSQVGATLAEAGNWPPSLRARKQALHHVERLQRSPQGQRLVCRLHTLEGSGMGQHANDFSTRIASLPQLLPLPPSPHASPLLDVSTSVPGATSKRRTALCAMQQETAALLHDHLRDRLLVFTDGSVSSDGSAAAACTAPDIPASRQCRLCFPASSTVAELAAIDLAADLLYECSASSAAILTDSRAALHMLRKDYAGLPLVQRVGSKLRHVVNQGCDLVLQWVPAHIGLPGNEAADALAKQALAARFPLATSVSRFDVARTTITRTLLAHHPDARVAAGTPPRLLPRAGLSRWDRAFLLRLRVGCYNTAARSHRLRGTGSPACAECGEEETLAHLLLRCPSYDVERTALCASYRRVGLPCNTETEVLFPAAHASIAKRAFAALLDFFVETQLRARL